MSVGKKPSVLRAPAEYSQQEQDFFRRELENFILNALSYVISVSNGTDTQSSLTHKRNQYMPTNGINVV
jgi:hypothetical protein